MVINNSYAMLNHKIGFLLAKLSLPAMAGMVIYSVFSLIDIFFVARLGPASLAALTFCIPVQVLIISVASATGTGLTSLIARVLGGGNSPYADNVAWHGLFMGLLYGLFFLFIGFKYMDEFLILLGCTPETFALSRGYLRIILAGCFFSFIPVLLENIIQGEGNTIIPVAISLTAIILNVAFDPPLIFGFGSFQGMGLNGAAWATVLAQLFSSIILIAIIVKRRAFLSWSLRRFKPSLRVLAGIYKVGIPVMIMELSGVFIIMVINRILADYSYTAVAALGIFLRVRSLIFMPVAGLLQGTMPIASFAYGAGKLDRVKETIIKASLAAFVIMATGWLIMQYYPLWIMSYFSNDPALTFMGASCLRLATIFLPLIGPVIILSTVLQALGKGFTAMWLSLSRQLGFFLPLLIILPHWLQLKGVWLAFSLSELLSALLAVFFLINLWKGMQSSKSLPVFVLFNRGYFLKRILAWLKW